MNSTMNYYELLGVKANATADEIKDAYKKQMKKWHPDINKSDDAISMSTKINEAKDVLLDEEKRRDYDIYLTKKTEDSFNRYTQKKKNYESYANNTYEDVKVTKWQYLDDWLKHSLYSRPRKLFGLIGVLLETLLCFIIKTLLIAFAYICNILSYFIRELFMYVYPIIGIILLVFVGQVITDGFANVIKENPQMIKVFIGIVITLLASMFLPILSNLVLSPKVFDILYNKIDINLFKKCVGYKE